MPTLVVDTNIVFSAIVKPGKIRDILFKAPLKLYAPEELVEELEELEPRILRYTRLSREEALIVKRVIITSILEIVPREEYISTARKIYPLLEKVDPKDTPFAALAMHLDIPLWTGDKELLRFSARTGHKHFAAVDTEGVEILLRGEPLDSVLGRMRRKYLG